MSTPNPWSDEGWKEGDLLKVSPCCKARIWLSRGDGVSIGTCSQCFKVVTRINPKTGKLEVPAE